MSGIYAFKQVDDQPPVVGPVGALGDISSALFAVVGTLAALRHRDQTGQGQYVDVAMLDAVVAMTDLVTNFWSMGLRPGGLGPLLIMDGFRAKDGWFIVQVGREHQFERLAKLIGHPEWLDDPRFATREGWRVHLEDVIRPAIEGWAADKTKLEAATGLNEAGIATGPMNTAPDVIADPHVAARNMLVEVPRTDGERRRLRLGRTHSSGRDAARPRRITDALAVLCLRSGQCHPAIVRKFYRRLHDHAAAGRSRVRRGPGRSRRNSIKVRLHG